MATITLKKLQSKDEIAKRNAADDAAEQALLDAESSLTTETEAVIEKIYQRSNGYFFAKTRCERNKRRVAIIGDSQAGYKVGQMVVIGIKTHPVYGPQFGVRGIVAE